MPINRAATLRNAEKLLRQGKLELAIAEYLRAVADRPRDWNSANLLGDLYVRAGQIDPAIAPFESPRGAAHAASDELQAEAGEYLDVESRIDRRTRVQARG